MLSPVVASPLALAGAASARTAATYLKHFGQPTLGAKTGIPMLMRALPPMVVAGGVSAIPPE